MGLGSPMGWIFIRYCLETPDDLLRWCTHEFSQHAMLYLYITVGTVLSFGLFGYFLGHLIQKIVEKDKLLEAKTKDYMRILGFVAHELRSPLTSVKGWLDLALNKSYGSLRRDLSEALQKAQSGCNQMNHMISDYLNLSRIERGELNLKFRDLNLLADVIQPVIDEIKGRLTQCGMTINMNGIKNDRRYVSSGDREWLKVVFRNLFSNAIRYGYPNTPIKLALHERKHEWRIEVYNLGYGIPVDHTEKIFQKFEKVPRDDRIGEESSGLGLYIVRDIIRQHGGDIRCESKLNEWANFILTLPKAVVI